MRAANLILDSASGYYPGITTQSDVTGSRSVTTTFQNTTTKPIFCLVSIRIEALGYFQAESDSNATPSLVIGTGTNGNIAYIIIPISFVVLPGNYYRVIGSSFSLVNWIEYT